MKKLFFVLLALCCNPLLQASQPAEQDSSTAVKEPFAFGDFTWLQGNNRQKSALLDSKYFTGSVTMDINYNYSFNRPVDHSISGSTATFRSNELNLSYIEFGGDFHHDNVRARLMLQLGTRATGIPRNDNSGLRGQFDLYNAYRYITEAYAGYHFDTWHGINIDVGMFKSYVGLNSYNNFENWNYQPSYTSDNTPWFFTGMRIQTFPSEKLKIEYWLINGWQTYAMFNETPGLGIQAVWRPEEWISVVGSAYAGYDTPNMPDRLRFHSDNSVLLRYYNNPDGFISKAAFALTGDIGFENGNGVTPFGGDGGPAQNFLSGMLYNRLWFHHDKIALTVGGGYIDSPGRYLILLPAGAASSVFTQNPGDQFKAWDISANIQYMPSDYLTWSIELVHRSANVPYFAGRGGITSPNGYNPPLGNPAGFVPDLVKSETRLIMALLCRF
jgi:hypothetical protein